MDDQKEQEPMKTVICYTTYWMKKHAAVHSVSLKILQYGKMKTPIFLQLKI